MKKLSKSDIKHLRAVAAKLPICYTKESQKTIRIVTGATLIANGVLDIKGEPIIPEKSYQHITEGGVRINHFRHLKKLCEAGKYESAQNYINEVSTINRPHFDLLQSMNQRKPSI